MRQKRLKHVNLDLMKELGVLTEVTRLELPDSDVYLEIGSGKGQFITSLANDNPNNLYIAIERNISVCYRIVEKKQELKLENLIIILGDSDKLLEYFNPNTVNKIYLNFSDPWPKARHHKRRLTFPTYLKNYEQILKDNGTIQFRTDHTDLFNDSLEYLETVYDILEVNRNYQSDMYYTEYEEKKREIGNIYQTIVRKRK